MSKYCVLADSYFVVCAIFATHTITATPFIYTMYFFQFADYKTSRRIFYSKESIELIFFLLLLQNIDPPSQNPFCYYVDICCYFWTRLSAVVSLLSVLLCQTFLRPCWSTLFIARSCWTTPCRITTNLNIRFRCVTMLNNHFLCAITLITLNNHVRRGFIKQCQLYRLVVIIGYRTLLQQWCE